MKIEFIERTLKEDSRSFKLMVKDQPPNKFIVIGEEFIEGAGRYLRCHQLEVSGSLLILGNMKLDQFNYSVPEDDWNPVAINPMILHEMDIPKKLLSMDCLDNIMKFNDVDYVTRRYMCTATFSRPLIDDDGRQIDEKELLVPEFSIWKKCDEAYMTEDTNIRLEREDKEVYVEITQETFEAYFKHLI